MTPILNTYDSLQVHVETSVDPEQQVLQYKTIETVCGVARRTIIETMDLKDGRTYAALVALGWREPDTVRRACEEAWNEGYVTGHRTGTAGNRFTREGNPYRAKP